MSYLSSHSLLSLTCVQIKPLGNHKVFHGPLLHVDPDTKASLLLAEVVTTQRDYLALLQVTQFIEQQLSRVEAQGPGGAGVAMAARRLLPSFVMTDKDMPSLNAFSKAFNGVK